ncbi:unnamed protein product [Pedinophyceae sp. YPF-701]|nr:unnamed protein product [Pedinophyceae sp. YPF-701]
MGSTEDIVKQVLEEDAARKKQKHGGGKGRARPAAGAYDSDPDSDGEGPAPRADDAAEAADVPEWDQSAKAAAIKGRREERRREIEAGIDDVQDGEEGGEYKRGGVGDVGGKADEYEFTAFNLKEERERGEFMKDGSYVFHKRDDDTDLESEEDEEKDAWVHSGAKESLIGDEEKLAQVKQRLQEQQAAMDRMMSGEGKGGTRLSLADVMTKTRMLVGMLKPEETVAKALKRLGAGQQRGRGAKAKAAEGEDARAAALQRAQAMQRERLMDLAEELASTNNEDIYHSTREALLASVDAFTAKKPPASDGAGPSGVAQAAADDDGDMFADDFDAKPAAAANGASRKRAREDDDGAAPAAANEQNAAPAAKKNNPPSEIDTAQFEGWPVAEVRRFIEERGGSAEGCVERADLVRKAAELAAAGPDGQDEEVAPGVPAGYVLDASSGYYWSAEAQMYYDAASQSFFDPKSQKWCRFDGQSMVPM